MDYRATDEWDETMWRQAEPVYNRSFPEHGRKSPAVIRRMFERRMCRLHTADNGGETVAMALTGIDERLRALLIDYIAVKPEHRGEGYGSRFLRRILDWARDDAGCRGAVVEVEAEPTPDNRRRVRFWERCGFAPTDYVHRYIWVPEPYRAMRLSFDPRDPLPDDGEALFRSITRFHSRAYRKR